MHNHPYFLQYLEYEAKHRTIPQDRACIPHHPHLYYASDLIYATTVSIHLSLTNILLVLPVPFLSWLPLHFPPKHIHSLQPLRDKSSFVIKVNDKILICVETPLTLEL